jgi:hypothetical protein
MYKSAFGNLAETPVPVRLAEFLPDMQQFGQGVQVGIGDWQLETTSRLLRWPLCSDWNFWLLIKKV